MLHRKLLEVLSNLSLREQSRLRQYLASPYFNAGGQADDLIRLCDYLLAHRTRGADQAMTRAVVHRHIFPDQPYQEAPKTALDYLVSDLFQLVRGFLNQQAFEQSNDEIKEHLTMARFYRRIASDERFWLTIKAVRKRQENSALRDSKFFLNQFLIEEEELTFRGLNNAYQDEMNLLAVHNFLDLQYSIQKLEYACLLTYQRFFMEKKGASTPTFLDEILQYSSPGQYLDTPMIRIYRLILQLLRQPGNADELFALEQLLNQHESQVGIEKWKELQGYVRHFWWRRYFKSGDVQSGNRIMALYQEHLAKGYFYINGLLPLSAFRNLGMFGLKFGLIEWVKTLLDEHPPKRIGSTRFPQDAHRIMEAEYLFVLKDFEAAGEKLVYRLFENPLMSIQADVLLLKIYYETQNDLLETRMKALDQKIRRSKRSMAIKKRYFNFLRFLNKINNYIWRDRQSKATSLLEEIQSTTVIIDREWLLEKARQKIKH